LIRKENQMFSWLLPMEFTSVRRMPGCQCLLIWANGMRGLNSSCAFSNQVYTGMTKHGRIFVAGKHLYSNLEEFPLGLSPVRYRILTISSRKSQIIGPWPFNGLKSNSILTSLWSQQFRHLQGTSGMPQEH